MALSPAIMAGLLPRLQRKALEHERLCKQDGVEIAFTFDGGRRSVEFQQHLFQRGRTLQNGVWVKTGRVVTNAMPGKAPHCPHVDEDGSVGGAAYDVAVVLPSGKLTLEENGKTHPAYFDVIGPRAEQLGLVWGERFGSIKDTDHFELADWRSLSLLPPGAA